MKTRRLGFPWETRDPFLFCVNHDDRYPAGNERMGPAASLDGRDLGQDFAGKDGWRMYHGEEVPGFPAHPHRGFETITIARRGLIDHSDSMGATARYGDGDVQWLTAGRGIQHAEMFPLVKQDGGNHLELFQIWLNLPRADKMVEPHFTMFWADQLPRVQEPGVEVTVVAGEGALAPPPHSWAARPEAKVTIWTVRLAPGATWTLPASAAPRTLYLHAGDGVTIDGARVAVDHAVDTALAHTIVNGPAETQVLVLSGKPIGEPVVQHGPFVMNSRAEILQAFADYQQTQFGGWPWRGHAPVHERIKGRFAIHADGRMERPGG